MQRKDRLLSLYVQEHLLTQLSQLLEQGYSLNQGLKILVASSRGRVKQVVHQLEALVSNGRPLSEAFERCAFSHDVLVMVAQADLHGHLSQALMKASEWKRRQIRFRAELRKAVTYPAILFVLMIIILFLLIQFVIPQFLFLFHTYDLTMPKSTQLILAFFYGLGQYGPLFIGLILLSLLSVLLLYKNIVWQERLIAFLLHIPGLKTMIQTMMTIMFCSQLGYMLYAHVSLYQALLKMGQNSRSLVGKRAQVIADQLLLGQGLSTAVEGEKLFVAELSQVIYFAEKNGQLGHQLIQYGHYLESFMVDRWLARLKWIEPILLTVVGVATAYLFVALFMPVFQLLEAM